MRDLTSRFSSLRAFHYPAYVRIWLGAFISNLGGWVQSVSLGIYVTETTGKAGWTGTIAALNYIPAVVLGPIGGVLADRYDRRKLLVPLMTIQALAVTSLAVLAATGRLTIGAIFIPALASGCAGALATPAYTALLSEIVEPPDLLSAISLNSGQFNLARTVGPMLAAIVLTMGGITFSFAINALSYIAVISAVAFAATPRTGRRGAEPRGSIWRGVVGGLRVARDDRGIRLALSLVLMQSLLVAPFIGLMPAYAIQVFGKGKAEASVMAVAQGAGALIASLSANAMAQRWGFKRMLTRSLTLVAPVAVIYWLSPWYRVAFGMLALLGGLYLWSLTALSTTCLGRVSRDLQARISSLYSVTLSGGYSLGLIAQGWLADHAGLRIVPATAAVSFLAVVLILRQRRAFDAVEKPSELGGVLAPERAE